MIQSVKQIFGHNAAIDAFVANYLSVKRATENNQCGYDLLDADGLRVSVKTITTSTGVTEEPILSLECSAANDRNDVQ